MIRTNETHEVVFVENHIGHRVVGRWDAEHEEYAFWFPYNGLTVEEVNAHLRMKAATFGALKKSRDIATLYDFGLAMLFAAMWGMAYAGHGTWALGGMVCWALLLYFRPNFGALSRRLHAIARFGGACTLWELEQAKAAGVRIPAASYKIAKRI